jgi:hypothetical protein
MAGRILSSRETGKGDASPWPSLSKALAVGKVTGKVSGLHSGPQGVFI